MQVRDIILQYNPRCRLPVSAVNKVKLDPSVCKGLDNVELAFLMPGRLRTSWVVKVGAVVMHYHQAH